VEEEAKGLFPSSSEIFSHSPQQSSITADVTYSNMKRHFQQHRRSLSTTLKVRQTKLKQNPKQQPKTKPNPKHKQNRPTLSTKNFFPTHTTLQP